MKKCLQLSLGLISCLYISALISGCSNDSAVTRVSVSRDNSVQAYFPLKVGNAIGYTVDDNLHQQFTHQNFTIDGTVSLNGLTGYQWVYHSEENPNFFDTAFFQVNGNALYYYDNTYAAPEKVLEGPLEVGKYWERFSTTDPATVDTSSIIDILTGHNGKNDGDTLATGGGLGHDYPHGNDGGGQINGKIFPTTGANYFIVAAVESITLSDGSIYQDCIRVENKAGVYTNYYWYAPGAGLVRYILSAPAGSTSEGQVMGEITVQRPF